MGSMYPYIPKSLILRNDSEGNHIQFTNVIMEISASLESVGMVTDAQWTDYNGDDWLDLIVVGEWMEVKVPVSQETGKISKEECRLLMQYF